MVSTMKITPNDFAGGLVWAYGAFVLLVCALAKLRERWRK